MKKIKPKSVIIGPIRIDPELKRRLDIISEREHRTLANLINHLLWQTTNDIEDYFKTD